MNKLFVPHLADIGHNNYKLHLALISMLLCMATPVCAQDVEQQTVIFNSGALQLAGTVTYPEGDGPFPGIVLVDGSGKTDRSNMRDFSLALATNGFATLAYDKRGVGESEGEEDAWRYFRFEDLATDAAAGARVLAEQPRVDGQRVGYLGISQGGWVVPLAATKYPGAFMVLISASVTTLAEDRLFERAARLRSEGFSAEEVAEATRMQLEDQTLTRTGEGFEDYRQLWNESRNKRWFRRVYLDEAPAPPDSEWRQWNRQVLDFDPVPVLESLNIPTLWIFGDPAHDLLSPVADSLTNLERIKAIGKDYTVHSFSGTNHNVMPVEGEADLPPYAPVLMEWLNQVTQ